MRGRLAPSPTGAQHVGNARTYLLAWLSARSQAGDLIFRIEDIDSPRLKPGASESLTVDLAWLGLDWDGEPIVQSTRLPQYEAALQQLIALDVVYPCTCTRSDIERAASARHAEHEGPIYPGTCAHRHAWEAPELASFAWRFRFPENGDFVVWKNSGTPAYQLAVVVDDAEMGVTEVVRGDDLLASTPRQSAIYAVLGLTPPIFRHVPLVIGPDGKRLAKRHGDTRLDTLRTAGVSPEALVGLLAWSSGLQETPAETTPRELLERFDWGRVHREPYVLEEAHLEQIGFRRR